MNCLTRNDKRGIEPLNGSADISRRASDNAREARNKFLAPFRRASASTTAGFTLMEVMIATGILVACLFAVLALVSNALVTARKLQQHKAIDAGTVASVIYVALVNTNRVDEGEIEVDWNNVLP